MFTYSDEVAKDKKSGWEMKSVLKINKQKELKNFPHVTSLLPFCNSFKVDHFSLCF
jgi:hypothetical protein